METFHDFLCVFRPLLSICFCCILQISRSAGEEKVGIILNLDQFRGRRCNLLVFSLKCIVPHNLVASNERSSFECTIKWAIWMMFISFFLDSRLTSVHYAALGVAVRWAPPRRCSIDTDTIAAWPRTLIVPLWVLYTVCYTYSQYVLYTISRVYVVYTLLQWGMKHLCSVVKVMYAIFTFLYLFYRFRSSHKLF